MRRIEPGHGRSSQLISFDVCGDRSTATELRGKPAASERTAKSKQSDEPKLTDDLTTQPDVVYDEIVPPTAPSLFDSDDYVSSDTYDCTQSVSQSPAGLR